MAFFCHRQKNVGAKFTLLRRGAAGGSRTRTPIRTQAPQACQSTSSSTAADHSSSTSCLIIILRLALFVNSIFSPARKKTAKKVLTPGTSYGNISLALSNVKRQTTCASGGIGRLAGFRCQCSQGRAGSTPASRTTPEQSSLCSGFFMPAAKTHVVRHLSRFCGFCKNGTSPLTFKGYVV